MLYDTQPAYVWDAGVTTDEVVLTNYNKLAQIDYSPNEFEKLQTTLHLATGLVLGVLRLEGQRSNIVLVKKT